MSRRRAIHGIWGMRREERSFPCQRSGRRRRQQTDFGGGLGEREAKRSLHQPRRAAPAHQSAGNPADSENSGTSIYGSRIRRQNPRQQVAVGTADRQQVEPGTARSERPPLDRLLKTPRGEPDGRAARTRCRPGRRRRCARPRGHRWAPFRRRGLHRRRPGIP